MVSKFNFLKTKKSFKFENNKNVEKGLKLENKFYVGKG